MYLKKYFIDRKFRFWILAPSLLVGITCGFTMTNRLISPWLPSSIFRVTAVLFLSVVVASFCYLFLTCNFTLYWMRSFSTRIKITWIILILIWAGLVENTIPFSPHIPSTTRNLEIIVDEKSNPENIASIITLSEVHDISGQKIPFHRLEKRGQWDETEGTLVTYDNAPASLRYSFTTRGGIGTQMVLVFVSKPGGGKVKVRLDGSEQVLDLNDKVEGNVQLSLDILPDCALSIPIYASEILTSGFLTFVLAIIFVNVYKKYPKMTLGLLNIFMALILIMLIAFNQKISGRLSNPVQVQYFQLSIWYLTGFCSVILAYILFRNRAHLTPMYNIVPYIVVLIFSFIILSDWNVFLVSPDSNGYVKQNLSARPPIYPLFINLITTGTDFDKTSARFENHVPVRDTNEPLLRVSRAQKVLLFTASIILVVSMSYLLGLWMIPVITVFILWLFTQGFFPLEMNYILTETITQAWLFFLLATMFTFFKMSKNMNLYLAGLLVAILYHTRTSAIYSGIFLAAMMIWAILTCKKQKLKSIFITLATTILLIMLPTIWKTLNHEKAIISPQYASSIILYGIQIAGPEDIDYMPDQKAKIFLENAITERNIQTRRIKEEYPNQPYLQYANILQSNVWLVAYPLADKLTDTVEEQEALLYRVSNLLIARHKDTYFRLVGYSMEVVVNQFSRLKIDVLPINLWGYLIIGLILCIFVRGWIGLAASACIFGHFFHVIIQCFFGVPETRPIYATEYLVLIAYFLLLWGIIDAGFTHFSPMTRILTQKSGITR